MSIGFEICDKNKHTDMITYLQLWLWSQLRISDHIRYNLFFITSLYKYLPLQVIQFILLKVNTFLHEIGSKSTTEIYMVTFSLLSM